MIAIVDSWSTATPCDVHLDTLAHPVRHAIRAAGAVSVDFNTIVVSDGGSRGTPSVRASLVSREVIAHSILLAVETAACPGAGACGGHFMAKTMAMALAMLGGSTNAVLHLMAIGAEPGVAFPLDAFGTAGATTPVIADLQPGGRELADGGKLTDAPTVTGRSLFVEAGEATETEGHAVGRRCARRWRSPPR